jgi:glycine oxidase
VRAEKEVTVHTARGEFVAGHFVNCCGAWAGAAFEGLGSVPVEPVKGQMVEMRCAPERLRCVVRAPSVYLIPRGDGRVTVGSTIQRVGFDTSVGEKTTRRLTRLATELVKDIGPGKPQVVWAGLRPGTPDGLPVMGPALDSRGENKMPHCWHATGHYRDGILLAPATARVMAQAVVGELTDVPLAVFAQERFARVPQRF